MSFTHQIVRTLSFITIACIAAVANAQDPEPQPQPVTLPWTAEMSLVCDDGTYESAVEYGYGPDPQSAIEDAKRRLWENNPDAACEEYGEPYPLLHEIYETDIAVPYSVQRQAGGLWKVRVACCFCNGEKHGAQGQGHSYCDAVRDAQRKLCILSQIYGGIQPCTCRWRILQRPCCCQPCCR